MLSLSDQVAFFIGPMDREPSLVCNTVMRVDLCLSCQHSGYFSIRCMHMLGEAILFFEP